MRVFVSSTYSDLIDHRGALNELLPRMKVLFSAMEFFGSRADEAIPACKKEISESDVLIGIYAWRYGWQPTPGSPSITEEEFDYARQLGKRCLCYLVDQDCPWPPTYIDKGESAERLTKFKLKVNALVRSQFTTPENLAMQVAADLAREMTPTASSDSFGGLLPNVELAAHQEIPGLDGARRQQVGAGLWASWRAHQRGAAILTGFAGTGKSDRIVGPLVARARGEGIPAVHIDVPLHPTDLDQELLGLLTQELQFNNYGALTDGLQRQPNFAAALAAVLRQDALVVIDEFQRVLDVSTARPIEPLGSKLRKLAVPRPDQGCLWLVSNRLVDPGWTEPFYSAELQPPVDVSDAQRIVLGGLGAAEADERFPAARRAEIVRRLGANPRVLRLLGALLRHYILEELLGPPGDLPELPPDLRLIEDTERTLLSKAREGLSAGAAAALRDLSVLREPATWEFVQAIASHLGDVRELTRELRERYLLEIGPNRYQVHPVVREVEGPRLRLDEEAWRAAHRRAGEYYARPLLATGGPHAGDAKIALALGGARYHLAEAQAGDVLRAAVRAVGAYIARKYHWATPPPVSAADRDARIALLEIFLEEAGPPATEYQLAKTLRGASRPRRPGEGAALRRAGDGRAGLPRSVVALGPARSRCPGP